MKTNKRNMLVLALCSGLAGWSQAATETETLLGKGYAAYDAANYGEAAAAFRRAAENGHAGAMLSLAQMYRKGQGVPQDDATALQWYVRAAEKGSAEAMNTAARAYELGLGVPKNAAESVKWTLASADAGDPQGMFMAGQMYEQGRPAAAIAADPARAQAWYQKARAAGSEEAVPRLLILSLPPAPAVSGQQGLSGSMERARDTALVLVGQDNAEEALRWWHYAAAKGDAASMFNLGLLYFSGWGVRKNDVEALRWWSAAAEAGHAAAMYDLAVMHENGSGLKRDVMAARYWYQRAEKNGFVQATVASNALDIRVLLERAFAAESSKSWGEARSCYEQAVKIGSVDAMTALGRLYENGRGVVRDGSMAISWYQKAVTANNAEAMFRLGVINHDSRPSDIPAATALYRQAVAAAAMMPGDEFWRDSALRRLQEISMAKATPRFRLEYQAAAGGDARAMVKLGDFYDQGLEGVSQNREEAFKWWHAAALRGHAPAMTLTGLRYMSAVGVQKDALKGLDWLSHAALLGNPDAMAALVDVYRKGDEGIAAEPRKSSYWLDRYTSAQKMNRQGRDEEMFVSQPEQQSHAYLLLHDADYALRFSAPARPANDSVAARRARPVPLSLWDAGSVHYLPVQKSFQEKALVKKDPDKYGAGSF